jgi:hypothetical protein
VRKNVLVSEYHLTSDSNPSLYRAEPLGDDCRWWLYRWQTQRNPYSAFSNIKVDFSRLGKVGL